MMPTSGADYSAHKTNLEKWAVHKILKFLFGSAPVELEFHNGDIRKLNHQNPTLRVAPPRLTKLLFILRNPNYHFPAAYVDGFWYCTKGELSDFVLALKNRKQKNTRNSGFSFGLSERSSHLYKQYLRPLKTRETRQHYNTNVDMYAAVLGESMVYSCAFFDDASSTLEEAQAKKIETTLARLGPQESEHSTTLDIGCGWGSLLFEAVQKNPGRYEGITIAEAQVEYANQLGQSMNPELAKRLKFIGSDFDGFRGNEQNLYDQIVSVGMLEHVGKTQYPRYFSEIFRLLKPGGRAVIHSITRRQTGITNIWIDKHVFPGGYIPRHSEVVFGIEEAGLELSASHVHNGLNYKKTLQCWLENLSRNKNRCLELLRQTVVSRNSITLDGDVLDYQSRRGYRMWEFYLSSIQCIFDKDGGSYDVTQFVVVKSNP